MLKISILAPGQNLISYRAQNNTGSQKYLNHEQDIFVKKKISFTSNTLNDHVNYARANGVELDCKLTELAEMVCRTIDVLKNKNFALPSKIICDISYFEGKNANRKGFFYNGEENTVFLNPLACTNSHFGQLFSNNSYSTNFKEHPIFHEIAHFLHYKQNKEYYKSLKANKTKLEKSELKIIGYTLGDYVIEKGNVLEFIAEAFTAFVTNHINPEKVPEIYEIYKKYKGPEIKV